MIEKYKTIESPSEGYFMDRSSKFYSFVYPVESEQEVKDILKQLHKKYHDARHIVYAYVIGNDGSQARASDAGEPSGSSGPPVLRVIQSMGLTNVMVAVVRYFGGKKLGIPGLINAYSTAARDALENAKIVEKIVTQDYLIRCDYNQISVVMNTIEKLGGKIIEQNYTTDCSIKASIPVSQAESFGRRLSELRIEHTKLK
jgi:uncharacterized YigZ family protein